ncbi:hypothetical protein D3C71_1563980 [compost metagenome]
MHSRLVLHRRRGLLHGLNHLLGGFLGQLLLLVLPHFGCEVLGPIQGGLFSLLLQRLLARQVVLDDPLLIAAGIRGGLRLERRARHGRD